MQAQVGTATAINNHMICSWHQSKQQKKQNYILEQEWVWLFFPQLVPVPVTELSTVNKSVSTKIYLSYLLYIMPAFKKPCRVSTINPTVSGVTNHATVYYPASDMITSCSGMTCKLFCHCEPWGKCLMLICSDKQEFKGPLYCSYYWTELISLCMELNYLPLYTVHKMTLLCSFFVSASICLFFS